MAKVRQYLIYSISTQTFRVNTRTPRLMADEIAWMVNVSLPDNMGRIVGSIDVTVPEVEPTVEVSEPLVPSGSRD